MSFQVVVENCQRTDCNGEPNNLIVGLSVDPQFKFDIWLCDNCSNEYTGNNEQKN